MMIDKHMIAEQKMVGKTKDGSPVLYVTTHGGLFGFFTKKQGEVETLATAPHKAIAIWMAEKKTGGIKWKPDFVKSEDGISDLKKHKADRFSKYHKLMFNQQVTDMAKSEFYFVYDMNQSEIGLLTKSVIQERMGKLSQSELKNFVVRNATLSDRPDLLIYHKEFR
jgi:hypothetical protein